MRVAVDASALGSGRGGDETSLRGILSGLAEVAPAWEHLLYIRPGAPMPDAVTSSPAFETRPLRHVGGLRRLAWELPRRLRRTQADVLLSLTHAPIGAAVPDALLVADLSFLHHPEHYPVAARARLRALVPYQARRAAGVLTVSAYSRDDLISSFGLDPSRVHVVPNAIESPPPLDDDVLEHARRRLAGRGVTGPFVLYLGNLHPRKNVRRLIEAFTSARVDDAALRDHRLVIAGARWWGHDEEGAARAAGDGAVVMVGRVDEEEREWLLRRATALAYPSLFEGFGLPPLEAMARGTAVVTSNVTSLPEVTDGAAVLVDPHDTAAIADALIRVVADDELRSRLVAAGRRQASTFTLRRTGEAAVRALEAAGRQ